MIRITDLPGAIQTAINGWRVWVTLALLVSLLLNEAVIGIRDGQTITQALTRIPTTCCRICCWSAAPSPRPASAQYLSPQE